MAERATPTLESRLLKGGGNLFQEIKRVSVEAESRGIELTKLSIGQPQGPALESAREAAAKAVISDSESMHEYQDNDSPGVPDFARRFIQAHLDISLNREGIDFVPIPGIKPMLGQIPLACGAAEKTLTIGTTTKPGYPTPKDWAASYLGQNVIDLPTNEENDFRFNPESLTPDIDLVMMNYPHNPSGQVASREWLEEVCHRCTDNGIRIFNDAAYAGLKHDAESTTLTEVAVNFPELSWAEAFSASKLIGNGTGWRIGAIAGSPDFVGDIKTIKGNTDSGFTAPLAAGVIHAVENDQAGIEEVRAMYERRIHLLTGMLIENGMQLAVEPKAGFFTLWQTPRVAFGEEMQGAEHFNFTMIEKTGIVGVHFEPYIRYAVCGDVEAQADKIEDAFRKAAVSY